MDKITLSFSLSLMTFGLVYICGYYQIDWAIIILLLIWAFEHILMIETDRLHRKDQNQHKQKVE